ncbi:MAG: DivIVA domain-containing protein [Clostridia bacterium]|nr:DivIVA domain-containing protein [Clostridia bacterium]
MFTPLDIENKKFQKQMMNGYNVDEVDDFLDELTVEYERLYKENSELKMVIENSQKDLEQYKSIEKTLQNTLLMAQKSADDMKKLAEQEAEQIVKSAQSRVQFSMDEITKETENKRKELIELKKQTDVYKAKMEALLISQLELLKEMKEDD